MAFVWVMVYFPSLMGEAEDRNAQDCHNDNPADGMVLRVGEAAIGRDIGHMNG